jgi:putative hydrolase of HD superfamily
MLKLIPRSGWFKKVGITVDCESVADHTFRTALMALVLGIEMGLDYSKLTRMCLIHDLAESVTGDIMPEEKDSEASHRRQETIIINRLIRSLPKTSQRLLQDDWRELVASRSLEARLVWQCDKLEMLIQAREYLSRGYDKQRLSPFLNLENRKKLDSLLRKFS